MRRCSVIGVIITLVSGIVLAAEFAIIDNLCIVNTTNNVPLDRCSRVIYATNEPNVILINDSTNCYYALTNTLDFITTGNGNWYSAVTNGVRKYSVEWMLKTMRMQGDVTNLVTALRESGEICVVLGHTGNTCSTCGKRIVSGGKK